MIVMIDNQFTKTLQDIVGPANVSVSRAYTELYSYDGSVVKATPGVVVFPADSSEAAGVVRAAHGAGVPFVPRGFGTNLSGGTVPPEGGARVSRVVAGSPADAAGMRAGDGLPSR